MQFIARFLQHVLPAGFSKVRYYGLFSPARKPLLDQARAELVASASTSTSTPAPSVPDPVGPVSTTDKHAPPPCPFCGIGVMRVIETLPRWKPPP
jgi:hypothetical protein